MLLVLDVGNTNIVLGVFDGENLKTHFRISTQRTRTSDEYGVHIISLLSYSGIKQSDIKATVTSTVVPPLTDTLSNMAAKYFGAPPLFVDPGVKTGLNIKYENPKEVGADRIVNAVAALSIYGGPCIIVDFGTATTYCAITEKSEYLGGAITPGIGISVEALFRSAARLPRVHVTKPPCVIGKNTVESMQSGIFHGYVSQVDGIVSLFKEEMDGNPKVIATGGLADMISSSSKTIDIVAPLLTLEGLRIIYNKNVS